MKPSTQKVSALLALLVAVPGCAYLRPDPMSGPIGQSGADQSGLAKRDDNPPTDGLVGFLEQTTFNVFKGYQDVGK